MPKCDSCPKQAVRNYQRIWHIFDIRYKDAAVSYLNEQIDYELDEPAADDNRHLCKEHETAFLAGEL